MRNLKVKYPKCNSCGKKTKYIMLGNIPLGIDGFYCDNPKCKLRYTLRINVKELKDE